MKKILCSILIALFFIFPVGVLAEGYVSVSPSSLTIEKGSSKTFNIAAYNAIGDVTIVSNNNGIASVSSGEWGTGMVDEKQTKSGTITVTGVNVGTTTITLNIDAATFDSEDLSGQTKTITVTVTEPTPAPTPAPTPTPTPAPTPSVETTTNNNLSKNNNIKSLSAEGHELVKVDNNNYTLIVTNDVTSISINATAEDSKASVTGTGNHELKVGENNIEVIVTSESGIQNKFNIKVTRKDGYYLEDLDSVLKNEELKDADIIINADSKISIENITKIRDSKKTIRLNYYDENKKLVYSWAINGTKIKDEIEFDTSITYTSDNIKEIYKLSNYADGLYINFKHSGALPTGTKIKLYVGDKFDNESVVNVYHYNNTTKTLSFIKDGLKVTDGYIEFEVEHCSEYFVTMSNIGILNKEQSSTLNIFMIFTIIESIIIIALVIFIFIKLKTIKKDNYNVDLSKNLENNNANAFNETESIQGFNTNNSINNYLKNNMNEFQKSNDTNIDLSENDNNLY